MKRLLITPVIVILAIACSACQRSKSLDLPIDAGCTVVYATDGEQALGGKNNDSDNPFHYIWFLPGENGDYDRVYISRKDFFPQTGMNDQGLFFGGMGLLEYIDVPQGDKEYVGLNIGDKIMRECGTVDCVIEYFDTYHFADTWSGQLLFGDALGNSAIIEPLHVIRMEGSYQVGTNFLQSERSPVPTGWRYQRATQMLKFTPGLSTEFIRDVMDAVHVEDEWGSYTQYSAVYDLRRRIVYLYHFHDYENVVVFILSEELEQGPHAYDIASLFPENPEWKSWAKPTLDRYELAIESNIDSSISPAVYDAYIGTYSMPDEMSFGEKSMSVVADGISLWLTFPGGLQLEFFPRSETSFFYVTYNGIVDYELNFVVEENGRVTKLEIVDGETIYICERQSDEILLALTPILSVEKPISVAVDTHFEPENDEDAAPILLAETPANEVEDVLVESPNDGGAGPDLLWITLVAGGVILLGGGLFLVIKTIQH